MATPLRVIDSMIMMLMNFYCLVQATLPILALVCVPFGSIGFFGGWLCAFSGWVLPLLAGAANVAKLAG